MDTIDVKLPARIPMDHGDHFVTQVAGLCGSLSAKYITVNAQFSRH